MRWPSFWNPYPPVEGEKDTTTVPDKLNDPLLSSTSTSPDTPIPNPLHSPQQSRNKQGRNWSDHLTTTPSALLLSPSNLVPTILLTATSLALYAFYRSYLRRIPAAGNISPGFFRKRSLAGRVTSVGDGDNFRVFHTPGGRLAGWGWFPGRKVPEGKRDLKDKTIHIRLAGIDAPELAHFGRPAQPYSQDALNWLTAYVLGRRVRAYVYKRDQYDRVVATVYVWKWLLRRDVGLQMLRAGLATVYEAKSGAEFGVGMEEKYRKAEWWAKLKRKGLWGGRKEDFESPREYKNRYAGGTPVGAPPNGK